MNAQTRRSSLVGAEDVARFQSLFRATTARLKGAKPYDSANIRRMLEPGFSPSAKMPSSTFSGAD